MIIVIMRGIPGQGKSTAVSKLVSSLSKNDIRSEVVELDQFFMKNGQYKFKKDKLKDAHVWCHKKILELVREKVPVIIFDDVNTQYKYIKPVLWIAQKYYYNVVFLEPEPIQHVDIKLCADRNTHGVPEERIKEMVQDFESDLELKTQYIIDSINLWVYI